MNKKDICFNGLTDGEESFKKKQNKCITALVRVYLVFCGWRLVSLHAGNKTVKASCPGTGVAEAYKECAHCSLHKNRDRSSLSQRDQPNSTVRSLITNEVTQVIECPPKNFMRIFHKSIKMFKILTQKMLV